MNTMLDATEIAGGKMLFSSWLGTEFSKNDKSLLMSVHGGDFVSHCGNQN